MERDPATYNEASETPDMASLDDPVDVLAEHMAERVRFRGMSVPFPLCRQFAKVALDYGVANTAGADPGEVARRLICLIVDPHDPDEMLLNAKALDYAFGLGIMGGITQAEIAEQHGCTRAKVSMQCREFIRQFSPFGIRPGPGMRSENAVEVYRNRELQKPRKARKEWSFKGVLTQSVKPATTPS